MKNDYYLIFYLELSKKSKYDRNMLKQEMDKPNDKIEISSSTLHLKITKLPFIFENNLFNELDLYFI